MDRLNIPDPTLNRYQSWRNAIQKIDNATTFEELQKGMKEIDFLTTPRGNGSISSNAFGDSQDKGELNQFAKKELANINDIELALADQNKSAPKKATNPFKSVTKALLKPFQRIGQFLSSSKVNRDRNEPSNKNPGSTASNTHPAATAVPGGHPTWRPNVAIKEFSNVTTQDNNRDHKPEEEPTGYAQVKRIGPGRTKVTVRSEKPYQPKKPDSGETSSEVSSHHSTPQ